MYAVVRTGGKQYRVAVDDILRVELLQGVKGDEVILDSVLMVSGDDGVKIGEQTAGLKVTGTILQQVRSKKVIVFKKKRRKNYRRKAGHRQSLTELKITAIQ